MQIASLHVNTEKHWRGGEQQVLHLLEGLRAHGHRAELAARPASPIAERAQAAGITVHTLPLRGEWDLPSAFRLARIVRQGRFDILHLHTSRAHGLGRIASILAPRPRVIVSRRVVFPPKGVLGRRLKYLNGIDKYIAISYAVRDILVNAGVAPERVAVVPSGVEPGRFERPQPAGLRRQFDLPPDAQLVGVVGHLDMMKGQRDFVDAAARIAASAPSAFFLIVGEGKDREALERQVVGLGLRGRVIFTGFRTDVPAVLAELDLFVMPSHAEGLCTSAVEAMFAGLPVVGTSAGGLREVVAEGQTGLLVPVGDPPALAAAIGRLLADASLRRQMGTNARQRAFDQFTVKNMVDKTIQVYEGILA